MNQAFSNIKLFALLFGALILFSCGPTRFVEPLNPGKKAITASLGGPLINVPGIGTIPIPFTSIGFGYGVNANTTVHGAIFPTAAIFGTYQFEMGLTRSLWQSNSKHMGVTIIPGFNFATDRFEWNSKLWPQLDVNYYWKYKYNRQIQDDLLTNSNKIGAMMYCGMGSWYELASRKVHNVVQSPRVVPIIQIGNDLNWRKWILRTEFKIMAPFSSNKDIVVDYKSLTGDNGAVGLYLGVIKRF